MTGFPQLLAALNGSGVKYVVVGGIAAGAHGSARITQDLDVVYERSPANLAAIVAALKPLKPYLRGAPPGLPFDWTVATLRAGLNFTLTTSIGDIDLIGEITGGGTYEDVAKHTVILTMFGHDTAVMDLPWLIRVKRAAGRPKDFEAIAELEALQEEIQAAGGPTPDAAPATSRT